MKQNEKRPKTGAERLRERFWEIKRNIRISPELEEATREKTPEEKKRRESNDDRRKIASPNRDKDLDL